MTTVREPTDPAPTAPTAQARPSRAKLVVILGSLSAFGPLSIDMYLPGLPDLADDLGTGAAQVQLTLSACLLGLASGQLAAGPLSDALGRRRPLLVGLAAYAVVSLLCVAAPTIGVLVALRFAQGFAGAAGIVIARAMVRDLHSGVAAGRLAARCWLSRTSDTAGEFGEGRERGSDVILERHHRARRWPRAAPAGAPPTHQQEFASSITSGDGGVGSLRVIGSGGRRQAARRTRWRSRSTFARPKPCRLSNFSFVT